MGGMESSIWMAKGKSWAFAAIPYAVTAAACLLFLIWFLDLSHHDLHYPIAAARGDCLFEGAIVKDILQTGWYTYNPFLGAPQEYRLYDFPMAEGVHVVLIRFLGVFSKNWAVVMNLFYLAQYVLCSLSALFVFRRLRLPALPSMAASLLFAFLPYHYLRSERHLFLSAYYLIPLMVLVLLWIAQGEPLILSNHITLKGWASLGICILMGGGGIYYAFFALLFLLVIAVRALTGRQAWLRARDALCCTAAICVSLLVNLAPSLLFFMRSGTNGSVAKRVFVEADLYGLTIAQLLLPIQNHRIPAFAALKYNYMISLKGIIPENDTMAPLGIVASAGFLLLIGIVLFGPGRLPRRQVLRPLATLNLAAVVTATLGSFGSLFALFISPQIRCYDRISIYIAFFSLTGLLAAIDSVMRLRPKLAGITGAGMAILIVAGLFDLTPAAVPGRLANAAAFDSDRAFVRAIEAAVPSGSMILQLPYQEFPEHGFTNRMYDYDHFRGYLFSENLRWSYGAAKGRPEASWQMTLAGLPAAQLLNAAEKVGFGGIYIDRQGFTDGAVGLVNSLSSLLGKTPIENRNHNLAFLPLGQPARGPTGLP
jgi:phosphoglycerol transferase